jgi:hypothetical protein
VVRRSDRGTKNPMPRHIRLKRLTSKHRPTGDRRREQLTGAFVVPAASVKFCCREIPQRGSGAHARPRSTTFSGASPGLTDADLSDERAVPHRCSPTASIEACCTKPAFKRVRAGRRRNESKYSVLHYIKE